MCYNRYLTIGEGGNMVEYSSPKAKKNMFVEDKDKEQKEILNMSKDIHKFYSVGNYQEALVSAQKLEIYIEQTVGKDNAVYASCLNNVALMHKMLGNFEQSIDKYVDALQKYEDMIGKSHVSYARTLANLGVLCKSFAEARKGINHYNSGCLSNFVIFEIRHRTNAAFRASK